MAEYSTELAQAPKVSYLTQDHLGSPRVITDEDGEVVSRHDYLAYGEELTQQLGAVGGRSSGQGYGAADEIRKKYTGYERDDESGLDYAKARYYDSFRGRYTSVDPLTASADVKNPQTFNRYTYVLNSPYKFTDPLGLISADTGACGSWCPGSSGSGVPGDDPTRTLGQAILDSLNAAFLAMAKQREQNSVDQQPPDGDQSANMQEAQSANDNQSSSGSILENENIVLPAVETSSNEVFDAFMELIAEIQAAFGLGAQTVQGDTIIEEINGLVRDLIRVAAEVYRSSKKAIKNFALDGKWGDYKARAKKILDFISKNVSYLAQKYDSPRYMVVMTNTGSEEKISLPEEAIRTAAQTFFHRAVQAARNDLDQACRQGGCELRAD